MSSWIPTEMTTYYWPTYTETWKPYETTYWYEPSTTVPPPPCRSYETTTLPPPPPPPPPTKPFIVTYENCQHSCAGLHYSDIWDMEVTLSKINIDDIFHFPYALASLIRKEVNLRESLKHRHFILTNGLTLIGGLTGELEFNLTMDPFVGRVNTSEVIAINMINSLSELLGLSTTEMNNVRSLQSSIHQTISYINSISSDISANEPNFWDEMIRRANSWVTEMSNIDLTSKLADSIVEREQSVVFLNQVSSFLSTYREQNSLLERINRLKYILHQIEFIINEQVNSPVYLVDQQMTSVRNSINALVLNATYNQERIVKYSESIREGFNHLEGSQVYFSIINKVTGDLETMSNDLNRSILAVERVRSIYSRLNPFYEDVYVNRCRDRVDKELSRINGAIEEYNMTINLLKPYIDIPQSNNQTVVLIERAEIDAEKAINTIVSQVIDSVVNQGTTSRATELRGTSNQIYREVVQQSLTISERSSELIEVTRFNEESRLVTDCFKSHETILEELNNFTVSIEASSRDTIEFSYILDMGLKSIESRVAEINESLGIIEGPSAVRVEEKWLAEMNEASNLVNQSSNLVQSISVNTERLSDVASKVRRQRQGMDTNLADLRKRILLAKQKAAEIRIALASEPDMYCIRSYVVETQPSSANSISMNYAIDQEKVRDALIFSIVNPDDGDFLAIDMVDRSIRFLWSLGTNGLTIIEHPMKLETSPENMEEDAHWYHIEAERIGTIGTLNVQRVVDGNALSGNPVKSVSSANYSILDVTSAHRLWIGGHLELDGFFVPSGAVSKGFQGCLADLMYDEKHIGLWDFSYTSPTGCKPCSKSALESGEYGVFQFNGKSSYSVLDQIPRYDNRNYQVVMLMRTFDESAIIFFCSDVDTGNYIAIHIVNGRVSFSFRDSPETWLKLVTTDKYNNGECG
uniref:Laminin G domain-containing protein n=1 Tax=Tetranychus urticae TaxID=32264 RepID=T1JRW7_TETUR